MSRRETECNRQKGNKVVGRGQENEGADFSGPSHHGIQSQVKG